MTEPPRTKREPNAASQPSLRSCQYRTTSRQCGPAFALDGTRAPRSRITAGVERATSLLDDIHHGEERIEGLHGAVEMVLRRALDAKDLRSAVAAIKAAADLLAEGRQYLELRGTVTGELDSLTTMINPIFGEQRIQVLAFPKCADVRGHVPLDATNKPD